LQLRIDTDAGIDSELLGHAEHAALPVVFLNCPVLQGWQVSPSAPVYPRWHLQSSITVEPSRASELGGHCSQSPSEAPPQPRRNLSTPHDAHGVHAVAARASE
jgi:hypothetical protein